MARARREDAQRVDPRELVARQLHPPRRVLVQRVGAGLGGREQPVVEVAPGGMAGRALEAQQLAGVDGVAALDLHLPEVRVHAAIAVAVVDHHHHRQLPPQMAGVEAGEIPVEVADPAHQGVEVATRRDHGPVVGGQDAVPTEGRDVDAVVEPLAVDDERAPRRRAEWERDPRVGDRPLVAGEVRNRRRAGRGDDDRLLDGAREPGPARIAERPRRRRGGGGGRRDLLAGGHGRRLQADGGRGPDAFGHEIEDIASRRGRGQGERKARGGDGAEQGRSGDPESAATTRRREMLTRHRRSLP